MHLGLAEYFLIRSEYELNKGYADIYLEPDLARFPDMAHGYVIELEYLKHSEIRDQGRQVAAALADAQEHGDIWPTRPYGAAIQRRSMSVWRSCSGAGI